MSTKTVPTFETISIAEVPPSFKGKTWPPRTLNPSIWGGVISRLELDRSRAAVFHGLSDSQIKHVRASLKTRASAWSIRLHTRACEGVLYAWVD